MTRSLTGLAVLGALAMAPAALAAQAICGGRISTPAAGNYAEYQVTQGEGAGQQVRFAIVGAQDQSAARNVWFETVITSPGQPTLVNQLLVPGFPYEASAIAAGTIQITDSAKTFSRRLSAGELARLRGGLTGLPAAIVEGCKSGTLVGTETIQAAGRSIRVQHYRNALRGSDIWVSSEVPFGIVKLTDGTDHTSMELTATGTGAKSSLKGSGGNGS